MFYNPVDECIVDFFIQESPQFSSFTCIETSRYVMYIRFITKQKELCVITVTCTNICKIKHIIYEVYCVCVMFPSIYLSAVMYIKVYLSVYITKRNSM